jgi:competence protein ComEA
MQTPSQKVQRSALLLLSLCVGVLGICLTLQTRSASIQILPHPLETQINPNTASLGELLTLPGIGPARAEAIVLYRNTHRQGRAFVVPEDLCQVHGLGPALVRDMAPWLSLGETAIK